MYVDYIVLTINKPSLLQGFISMLSSTFALKNMGSLHYFLGIEVIRSSFGFFFFLTKICLKFVTQGWYVRLQVHCHSNGHWGGLSRYDGGGHLNDETATSFCSLVDSLQYY